MQNTAKDAFDDAAGYERYVGRWSRFIAAKFVDWLEVGSGKVWLDVGAGTGVLTQVILDRAAPEKVVAIDISDRYLAYARQAVPDPRAEFIVGDAANIGSEMPSFDAVVAGLVLNFVPIPADAVRGMREAVKSGGTVAAYVWDYGDCMEMMRHFWDAAMSVDPVAREFKAQTQYAICNPDSLRVLFEAAELRNVETAPIDIPTTFADFDDFWQPFLGAQGSISKFFRSRDDAGKEAIRRRLLEQLPISADGTIPLTARAWAVKAIR
jgi:ubiquinone/menaquinone biosynthesis C-methylase UbiE